jgi:hypothetical protein
MFPVRYVSGGLLFLKPLGTFINMRLNPKTVNLFLPSKPLFPQEITALFRSGYEHVLCIPRG